MDKLTLHVTNNIYQMFQDGRKTIEYRPLNAFYFSRLDKFRLMFEWNQKLLCKIYGDEVQNTHFYALYTL